MITSPIKTRIFREGDDLLSFISSYLKKLPEKSILIITSKIVALSEKRTVANYSQAIKEKLIKSESSLAIPTKKVWLTITDGLLMPSAGIDESNANGKLILLPKNSFATAERIRQKLCARFGITQLGIIISDSRTLPLRAGVVGVALGYAGFQGLKDYRGTPDIFGRKFEYSTTNCADSLATAAVLVMGEGREQQPLAVIKNSTVEFCNSVNPNELIINPEDDMYRPLFSTLTKL